MLCKAFIAAAEAAKDQAHKDLVCEQEKVREREAQIQKLLEDRFV